MSDGSAVSEPLPAGTGAQLDETLRRIFLPDPADRVERYRTRLLCDGDVEALLDLYDEIAPTAYGWARSLTRSRRQAVDAIRQAFLTAARQPHVFCNQRISSQGWILLEIHHIAWTRSHPPNRMVSRSPAHRLRGLLGRVRRAGSAVGRRPSWPDVP